jgi:hypothetical protein
LTLPDEWWQMYFHLPWRCTLGTKDDDVIAALKTAFISLASGTNQEYSVDTGVIKKTFVKKDLEKVSQQLEWL